MNQTRHERIAEAIQRKLAEIIRTEIRDPRLPQMITLSAVEVSKDLGHAKVYFTVLGSEPEKAALILNTAASYLRTALARTLKTRVMPSLHFVYDESLAYADRLSRLIDDANPHSSDDAEQ